MALGYSYKRFSSPEQAKGRSLERQTEFAKQWCERNKVQLDASLHMTDAGVPSAKGQNLVNPDVHALAGFIQAVRNKRVQSGSFLICESFDRLSRAHWRLALPPLMELINAGIRLVQLAPEQIIDDKTDAFGLIGLIITLARGQNESDMKSTRSAHVWQDRRKKAREKGKPVGGVIPGWCEYRDEKIVANTERAAVVRRIFKLASSGNSLRSITKILNGEEVKPFSEGRRKMPPKTWADPMVYNILRNRNVLGEYQPHKGRWIDNNREREGEVIKNYYPQVVTEEQWHATRHAIEKRRTSDRGRRSKHVNLFTGLLWDVTSDGRMSYWHEPGRAPKIFPTDMKTGRDKEGATWKTFNSRIFEQAVLSQLVELKASDVMPGQDATQVEVLAGRLTEVEQGILILKSQIEARPVLAATLGNALANELEKQRKIGEELADAQRLAASPMSEAFGQFKKIAGQTETEEQRKRVRTAILRIIESIKILIVGKGRHSRTRMAYVFVRFVGGAMRVCLILHQQAGNRAKEAWSVGSIREEEMPNELNWQETEKRTLDNWSLFESFRGVLPVSVPGMVGTTTWVAVEIPAGEKWSGETLEFDSQIFDLLVFEGKERSEVVREVVRLVRGNESEEFSFQVRGTSLFVRRDKEDDTVLVSPLEFLS
ncbi:recombinase family protein [Gemmata sp. G18]|uniref:Recombinase family protein n=1 Tax=Gemmata palustris TaxID=2822762 RepID=A0ABS5BUQ3_9BACT|nr:recombinase family protein [Gemmata palustris]MBP3957436.1 recombinase family protein [Gemmata palustris]